MLWCERECKCACGCAFGCVFSVSVVVCVWLCGWFVFGLCLSATVGLFQFRDVPILLRGTMDRLQKFCAKKDLELCVSHHDGADIGSASYQPPPKGLALLLREDRVGLSMCVLFPSLRIFRICAMEVNKLPAVSQEVAGALGFLRRCLSRKLALKITKPRVVSLLFVALLMKSQTFSQHNLPL